MTFWKVEEPGDAPGLQEVGTATALGLEAEQLQHGRHRDGGADRGEVDGRARGSRRRKGLALVLGLALFLAPLAGLGQLAVAGSKDFLVPALQLVFGGDVADGTVQTHVVVMGDVVGDEAPGVVQRQGSPEPEALSAITRLENKTPAKLLVIPGIAASGVSRGARRGRWTSRSGDDKLGEAADLENGISHEANAIATVFGRSRVCRIRRCSVDVRQQHGPTGTPCLIDANGFASPISENWSGLAFCEPAIDRELAKFEVFGKIARA